MVEYPPSFLTEHDPLRIVGIAALQISNPANRTFFHHQAILYGKACLHQAVIMIWIAVKAGKEISMSIIL